MPCRDASRPQPFWRELGGPRSPARAARGPPVGGAKISLSLSFSLSLHMCVYIYIYTYVCVYVYMYVCMYICICICMYIYIHIYIYIYIIDGNMYNLPLYIVAQGRSGSYSVSG